MSRIIHTEAPGKVRNQHRRTIAEALRRLSQKSQLDDEVQDLAALIIFSLHGMADTIDRTTDAWEKRDYWMKAERFREEWRWLESTTDELSAVTGRPGPTDAPLCRHHGQADDPQAGVVARRLRKVHGGGMKQPR
jgi:hypothetical protein